MCHSWGIPRNGTWPRAFEKWFLQLRPEKQPNRTKPNRAETAAHWAPNTACLGKLEKPHDFLKRQKRIVSRTEKSFRRWTPLPLEYALENDVPCFLYPTKSGYAWLTSFSPFFVIVTYIVLLLKDWWGYLYFQQEFAMHLRRYLQP